MPYTLYTDVVEFQSELRDRVHPWSLRTHKKRRRLFRKVAVNTLRPISYRFGYLDEEVESIVKRKSDKIIKSKMRRYHTTVRRGYLLVSCFLFCTSLLMIIHKGYNNDEWRDGLSELMTPWQVSK